MNLHTPSRSSSREVALGPSLREESEPRGTTSLLDLARIFHRRRRTIAVTLLAGTGISVLLVLFLPPYFVARTTLAVSADDANIISSEQVTAVPPDQKSTIETHVQRLLSDSFLDDVVARLELAADPEFANPIPLPRRVLEMASSWLPSAWAARANELVAAPDEATPQTLQRLAVMQLSLVTLTRQVADSYVIAVELGSYDASKAARIANTMAETYVERQLKERRAATTEAAAWLSQQISEMRTRVSADEQSVASFQRTNGLSVGGKDDPFLRQIEAFNAQLVDAQAKRAEVEARMSQIESLIRGDGRLGTTADIVGSPLLGDLRRQVGSLEASLAERSRTLGVRHPEMQQGFAQRDQLRTDFQTEVRRIIGETRNEVAVARAREQILRENIARLERSIGDKGGADIQLHELRRAAEASNAMYKAFLGRYEELEALKQIVEPGIQIDSVASVPVVPAFPNIPMFVGVGFVGSALLGCMLAFLREAFDSGVHTKNQVRRAFGLPTLAMMPEVRLRRAQRRQPLPLVQAQQPRSAYAEGINTLRTELRYVNVDREPHMVLLTSSLPGEGKSTLSTSLAIAETQSQTPVLLVDLDLHRGRLSRMLGVSRGGADLIDVLTGDATLDDAIAVDPQGIRGLHLLSAHSRPANPGALLASRKMADLLAELRIRYRLAVLDAPPVLAAHDVRLVAPHVDVVLFVIRWSSTKLDAARAGLELLSGSHMASLGVVLNRVDVRRHASRSYGDALQYHRSYASYYQDAV